nr:uncharacterized protein LOC109193148 isoform X2 [Ipomoea batatas]
MFKGYRSRGALVCACELGSFCNMCLVSVCWIMSVRCVHVWLLVIGLRLRGVIRGPLKAVLVMMTSFRLVWHFSRDCNKILYGNNGMPLMEDDIVGLGFGSLLEFQITDCPPRLLRWLLANFDSTMRTFDLGGGRSLVVDERDVELLLGFPCGPVEMVKWDKLEISNMLKHWRDKFEKTRHTVTCAEIATKVKALVDGGLWFKRHFTLLLGF